MERKDRTVLALSYPSSSHHLYKLPSFRQYSRHRQWRDGLPLGLQRKNGFGNVHLRLKAREKHELFTFSRPSSGEARCW